MVHSSIASRRKAEAKSRLWEDTVKQCNELRRKAEFVDSYKKTHHTQTVCVDGDRNAHDGALAKALAQEESKWLIRLQEKRKQSDDQRLAELEAEAVELEAQRENMRRTLVDEKLRELALKNSDEVRTIERARMTQETAEIQLLQIRDYYAKKEEWTRENDLFDEQVKQDIAFKLKQEERERTTSDTIKKETIRILDRQLEESKKVPETFTESPCFFTGEPSGASVRSVPSRLALSGALQKLLEDAKFKMDEINRKKALCITEIQYVCSSLSIAFVQETERQNLTCKYFFPVVFVYLFRWEEMEGRFLTASTW
jgi:hypothetical protein